MATQRTFAQVSANIPVPGDSVDDTVGYITVYNSEGSTPILDGAYVVLNG